MLAHTTPASASNVAVVAVDGTSDDLDEPIAALFQVCTLSLSRRSCRLDGMVGWMWKGKATCVLVPRRTYFICACTLVYVLSNQSIHPSHACTPQ